MKYVYIVAITVKDVYSETGYSDLQLFFDHSPTKEKVTEVLNNLHNRDKSELMYDNTWKECLEVINQIDISDWKFVKIGGLIYTNFFVDTNRTVSITWSLKEVF